MYFYHNFYMSSRLPKFTMKFHYQSSVFFHIDNGTHKQWSSGFSTSLMRKLTENNPWTNCWGTPLWFLSCLIFPQATHLPESSPEHNSCLTLAQCPYFPLWNCIMCVNEVQIHRINSPGGREGLECFLSCQRSFGLVSHKSMWF